MAQNITLWGASYSNVPSVLLPKTGGGTASFTDVTDTTASASDVASGTYFYTSAGVRTQGTASGGGGNLQAKTNIDPTTSSQTITADTGYDGLSSVQINAMPSGSIALPTALSSSGNATVTSNGTEITLNKSMSIMANVTQAGYVSSVPSSTADVTLRATDANFLAENIKSGVTLFGKAGSYTGGGGWTKIGNTTELTVNTTSTSAASAGTIALGSGHFTKSKIIYVRVRDKSGKRNGYFYGSDTYFMNWQNANGSTTTLSVVAQEYYRYNNNAYTGAAGAYGVYGYSINSSGTLTIRRRYNSTNTLTINSTYTIDVYEIDPPLTLFA